VGEEPNGVALGDWDGNGSTDIAVFSAANNLVSIFKNHSGVAVQDWFLY